MVLLWVLLVLCGMILALMGVAIFSRSGLRFRWAWTDECRGYGYSVSLLGGAVVYVRAVRGKRRRSILWVLGRRVGAGRRQAGGPSSVGQEPSSDAPTKGGKRPGFHKMRYGRRTDWQAWWSEWDLIQRWLALVTRGLARLPRCVRLEPASFVLRLGAGDPALTGVLYGYAWSVLGPLLGVLPFRTMVVEADWLGFALETRGQVGLWTRPVWATGIVCGIIVRAPWRATWRAKRRLDRHRRDRSDARPRSKAEGGQ